MNVSENSKRLNIAKKKKYTIIEGIKLFELTSSHKQSMINSSSFWNKVVN